MARFRISENMLKDEVDAISVQGQEFKVDKDGFFDAPDHFYTDLEHLGVKRAVVDPPPAPKEAVAKSTDVKKG